jgi:DNA mismatch endonuclease, patch repair protein
MISSPVITHLEMPGGETRQVDTVSSTLRSKVMSSIRSKNTGIENAFALALRRTRFKFDRHAQLRGTPDFVFWRFGVVVFLDSCFWHKCPRHYREPKSRQHYWIPKIQRNVDRDRRVRSAYRRKGWTVLCFWEHQIHTNLDDCIKRTVMALRARRGVPLPVLVASKRNGAATRQFQERRVRRK